MHCLHRLHCSSISTAYLSLTPALLLNGGKSTCAPCLLKWTHTSTKKRHHIPKHSRLLPFQMTTQRTTKIAARAGPANPSTGHTTPSQANTGITCEVRKARGSSPPEVAFPKPTGSGTYGIPLYRFASGDFTTPRGGVPCEGTTFNISEELRRTWMRQLGV